MLFPTSGWAQEAVRASLAGEEAAAARRSATSWPDNYNARLGPTAWDFSSTLAVEAQDNVQLTPQGAEGDVIFRPELRTQLAWPITERNSLDMAVAAGYSAYIQHSDLSRFFIAPGSEVSMDLYAGDFWFNYHDRLSITENSYQDPTAVGAGNYSQLQNDAGVGVTWDLNKLVARLGYDHMNYLLLNGSSGAANGSSEVFNLSAGCTLLPGLTTGVEAGGGLLSYGGNQSAFRNATEWNTG
ncbi:MAG TPA: hypothetical protein VHI52_21035, partial [Verrucomicrobiae bacterium]|nr:hypothetical protein [Verrucomicrobiae bacterium]